MSRKKKRSRSIFASCLPCKTRMEHRKPKHDLFCPSCGQSRIITIDFAPSPAPAVPVTFAPPPTLRNAGQVARGFLRIPSVIRSVFRWPKE